MKLQRETTPPSISTRFCQLIVRIHPANPLEEAEAGEVCGCD